jgi:hypothetical protein
MQDEFELWCGLQVRLKRPLDLTESPTEKDLSSSVVNTMDFIR